MASTVQDSQIPLLASDWSNSEVFSDSFINKNSLNATETANEQPMLSVGEDSLNISRCGIQQVSSSGALIDDTHDVSLTSESDLSQTIEVEGLEADDTNMERGGPEIKTCVAMQQSKRREGAGVGSVSSHKAAHEKPLARNQKAAPIRKPVYERTTKAAAARLNSNQTSTAAQKSIARDSSFNKSIQARTERSGHGFRPTSFASKFKEVTSISQKPFSKGQKPSKGRYVGTAIEQATSGFSQVHKMFSQKKTSTKTRDKINNGFDQGMRQRPKIPQLIGRKSKQDQCSQKEELLIKNPENTDIQMQNNKLATSFIKVSEKGEASCDESSVIIEPGTSDTSGQNADVSSNRSPAISQNSTTIDAFKSILNDGLASESASLGNLENSGSPNSAISDDKTFYSTAPDCSKVHPTTSNSQQDEDRCTSNRKMPLQDLRNGEILVEKLHPKEESNVSESFISLEQSQQRWELNLSDLKSDEKTPSQNSSKEEKITPRQMFLKARSKHCRQTNPVNPHPYQIPEVHKVHGRVPHQPTPRSIFRNRSIHSVGPASINKSSSSDSSQDRQCQQTNRSLLSEARHPQPKSLHYLGEFAVKRPRNNKNLSNKHYHETSSSQTCCQLSSSSDDQSQRRSRFGTSRHYTPRAHYPGNSQSSTSTKCCRQMSFSSLELGFECESGRCYVSDEKLSPHITTQRGNYCSASERGSKRDVFTRDSQQSTSDLSTDFGCSFEFPQAAPGQLIELYLDERNNKLYFCPSSTSDDAYTSNDNCKTYSKGISFATTQRPNHTLQRTSKGTSLKFAQNDCLKQTAHRFTHNNNQKSAQLRQYVDDQRARFKTDTKYRQLSDHEGPQKSYSRTCSVQNLHQNPCCRSRRCDQGHSQLISPYSSDRCDRGDSTLIPHLSSDYTTTEEATLMGVAENSYRTLSENRSKHDRSTINKSLSFRDKYQAMKAMYGKGKLKPKRHPLFYCLFWSRTLIKRLRQGLMNSCWGGKSSHTVDDDIVQFILADKLNQDADSSHVQEANNQSSEHSPRCPGRRNYTCCAQEDGLQFSLDNILNSGTRSSHIQEVNNQTSEHNPKWPGMRNGTYWAQEDIKAVNSSLDCNFNPDSHSSHIQKANNKSLEQSDECPGMRIGTHWAQEDDKAVQFSLDCNFRLNPDIQEITHQPPNQPMSNGTWWAQEDDKAVPFRVDFNSKLNPDAHSFHIQEASNQASDQSDECPGRRNGTCWAQMKNEPSDYSFFSPSTDSCNSQDTPNQSSELRVEGQGVEFERAEILRAEMLRVEMLRDEVQIPRVEQGSDVQDSDTQIEVQRAPIQMFECPGRRIGACWEQALFADSLGANFMQRAD